MRRFAAVLLYISTAAGCAAALHSQTSSDPRLAPLESALRSGTIDAEDTPAFQMEAQFSGSDYLGKAMVPGTLTFRFLKPQTNSFSVQMADSTSPSAEQKRSADFLARFLMDLFLHPGPAPANLASSTPYKKEVRLGSLSLRCFTVIKEKSAGLREPDLMEEYCLGGDVPILRVTQRYGLRILYNNFVRLGGRIVPKEITVQDGDRVRGILTVSHIALAPALNENDFSPNERFVLWSLPKGIRPEANGPSGLPKSRYPESVEGQHLTGRVYLHALIGKDGSVQGIDVLSAPAKSLADSAAETVRHTKYKPVGQDGMPKSADTLVVTSFWTYP